MTPIEMRRPTVVRQIIFILTTVITLSLISSPSIAAAVNMPNPPTASTPDTQGQVSIPNLPPLTETKDKDGNTILSSEDKSKKIDVESLLPEGLSEKEKSFFRGYMAGYAITIKDPSKGMSYAITAYRYSKLFPEYASIGFRMGVNDALAAKDLVRDTIEALGITNIPSKPIS